MADKEPGRWEYAGPFPGVVRTPDMCFGRWRVKDTRIVVAIVLEFIRAGDSPDAVAKWFSIPVEWVHEMIAWHKRVFPHTKGFKNEQS